MTKTTLKKSSSGCTNCNEASTKSSTPMSKQLEEDKSEINWDQHTETKCEK